MKHISHVLVVFIISVTLLACNFSSTLLTTTPTDAGLPSVTPTIPIEDPANLPSPTVVPQSADQPASAAGPVDFCSLVTKADVEKFFAEPAGEPRSTPGGCAYTNAKDSLYAFSIGAGQDKDAANIMQGQAMLLGMAGVKLDETALGKIKPLADALDFNGFFTELVTLSKSSTTIKAKMFAGGGNDLTYWAWITVPPRRTGAFTALRGKTLVSLYMVVPESQPEDAMLTAANNLAGFIFTKLPPTFSLAATSSTAPQPQSQPTAAPVVQATPTLVPSATLVTGISAPKLLSPANDTVFSNFPRTTTFTWSPVPGASKYVFELMACSNNNKSDCFVWPANKPTHDVTSPTFTINFVGAQPGKWRVTAIDANGLPGTPSDWWMFRYTK